MKITDLLPVGCIDPRLITHDFEGAVSQLTLRLHEAGSLEDPISATAAILGRHAISSCAIGHGVALPHARIEGCDTMKLAVGRPLHPIAMPTPDDHPVALFFLLISPADKPTLHVQTLSRLIRLVSDTTIMHRLLHVRHADAMHRLLTSVRITRNLFPMVV